MVTREEVGSVNYHILVNNKWNSTCCLKASPRPDEPGGPEWGNGPDVSRTPLHHLLIHTPHFTSISANKSFTSTPFIDILVCVRFHYIHYMRFAVPASNLSAGIESGSSPWIIRMIHYRVQCAYFGCEHDVKIACNVSELGSRSDLSAKYSVEIVQRRQHHNNRGDIKIQSSYFCNKFEICNSCVCICEDDFSP